MTPVTLSASSTPASVVRPLTRRERRVERMRTQHMAHAARSTYRTSGTPYMARNGLSAPGAAIYITNGGTR
jgi:hypothetical protein